jgi:hypothetical protein
MTTLSLRRLWTMYKRTAIGGRPGSLKRDREQVLVQNAHYGGGRLHAREEPILAACFLAAYASAPASRPANGNARYAPAPLRL